ncbi:MAG: HAMP domain-containing protein [Gemmatimonadales bacterium]|nr:HAMP domain-containing protein [Gemmatimonadales bacterium]NIN10506.1 HAMP domain-containing protein [Gemmatimonadales bacterium]NIN49293.1 HAMP domain-containing protein [Gemmatimonadales bacterium]NIP06757.1 HAMP domain-containing protein [Gemmatimonadales bacterium]NIR02783.1 HAMP domain-containing protein [Gemmatimonadales bacterium]
MSQESRRGARRPAGLRGRILLWFLVLSLVPLFVSNTVGYQVTRRILEGQVQRYLAALAGAQAHQIASELERHHLYLDAVAAGEDFLASGVPLAAAEIRAGRRQAIPVSALHEYLDRKLAELESLSELFLIDSTGFVVAATRHARVGTDLSDSEVFRRAHGSRFFTDRWATQASLSGPVYLLATPIRDGAGSRIGVLAGTVGLGGVTDFLRIPPHLAEDVHTYVVDQRGYPLIVPHLHESLEYGEPFPSPLVEEPVGSIARYRNYEGVEVLATSVAMPGLPWLYIAEQPVASAFGQLRSLALLAAVLEVAFALMLVAVVWVVARSIVAPLRRLVSAAERIRGGELGVEVAIDRQDELGDLGNTFNQMSRELKTSAQQIQELHDQEMRRAAQLASVGELASGIAHEIKNPLVVVASGVDLLSGQLQGDSQKQNILAQIRAQLRRIESAIRDLLSYARPKELRLVWADPQQLVDRVVGLVGAQADAASVRIEKRQAGTVPQIRVDPELMTQALVNLALNGIQAMGPGGLLSVSTESTNGGVRISVSDTGAGIPMEQRETIFRPFYTTKRQGTGLGLAISRGIVERHRGRIEVESEPGEGSTFRLVFTPAEQEPPES